MLNSLHHVAASTEFRDLAAAGESSVPLSCAPVITIVLRIACETVYFDSIMLRLRANLRAAHA